VPGPWNTGGSAASEDMPRKPGTENRERATIGRRKDKQTGKHSVAGGDPTKDRTPLAFSADLRRPRSTFLARGRLSLLVMSISDCAAFAIYLGPSETCASMIINWSMFRPRNARIDSI